MSSLAEVAPTSSAPQVDDTQIQWGKSLPFLGVHLACLAAFWTGVSWRALVLCFSMYVIRMFGITGAYHRYFSHRSYKTSRWFQFVLAWIGCSAMQKGPLWWAAHHRHHHQHSDEPEDVHSPQQRGFWWAHLGWVLSDRHNPTNFDAVKDLAKYPELRWLNHWSSVPGIVVAAGCLLVMGAQGLVWGFFVSSVMVYHATFTINSLCHVFGKVRYKTKDTSRNSMILAIVTLGEGWHNNHHFYSSSARTGFFWWEIDFSYYALCVFAFFGLVWDLKQPSPRVFEASRS
jgi:stearoyl-CoA desaturase (delta-9 desaturase)